MSDMGQTLPFVMFALMTGVGQCGLSTNALPTVEIRRSRPTAERVDRRNKECFTICFAAQSARTNILLALDHMLQYGK